jgi:formiminotetrahydrofolate cyclodeaminase
MKDVAIEEWLQTLAARTPTPGGGAVAALAAASAAALIGMVTSYTTGEQWADREVRMRELHAQADEWRTMAVRLAEEDERAFALVGEAYALPKASDDEKETRRVSVQRALAGAAEPPIRTAQLAGRVVDAADELATSGNPNVLSDVGVASALAEAAITSAMLNIAINASQLTEPEARARLSASLTAASEDVEHARSVTQRVLKAVSS